MKAVLFDLDGVLIDAKEIHFQALNTALAYVAGERFTISREEHVFQYDGLPTREKLKLLTLEKKLSVEKHDEIYRMKQQQTIKHFKNLKPNQHITELFYRLRKDGYRIGVCSNSIRDSLTNALSHSGLMDFVEVVVSNQDVLNPKPHPEMYWMAMEHFGVLPEETLIVEDSPSGLLAAQRSGANYMRVKDPSEVKISTVYRNLNGRHVVEKWKDEKLNVLIPMAGAGSRFAQAGYTFPKPLIEVNGKPMIQLVVENLGLDANYIFVVQKEHREKYNLDQLLKMIAPGCKIVETNGMTEGAACTALLAEDFIDNENPLFFANSDQFVEWNPIEFMYDMQESAVEGGIAVFESVHPKWSFAKVDEKTGLVTEVAEKKPISNLATCGFYYWKHGFDFVQFAKDMIFMNKKVNGEYYVCPVFNEAIKANCRIKTHKVKKMWGLGVPEDLEEFVRNYI